MAATTKSVKKLWILLAIMLIISVLLLVGIYIGLMRDSKGAALSKPQNYEQCIKDTNSVILETYPEQCMSGGKSFTNPNQSVAPPVTQNSQQTTSDQEAVLAAYTSKNGICNSTETTGTKIKKISTNGWAELNALCEPGNGHIEVWHKVNGTWTYVVGYQDGPYCTMVIEKNISKELFATCIAAEAGPTTTENEYGQPTIPNQIP